MRALLRNPMVRSIGGVGGAALSAQAIGLAASPVISRLFSQADFGQFGLFFGLANVLVTLALFGLPDALLAAPTDRDARTLLGACLYSVALWSPALGFVTWVLIRGDWFGYGALPAWSAVPMVLEVGAIAGIMLLQMWLIRQRRFRALASGHLAQGLTRSGAQIAAGVARAGYAGLSGGEIVGRWCVVLVLARPLRSELAAAAKQRAREIGRVVWRYRLFPIFRTPSTLANNLGTALPLALVTMAYGVSAAGLFTLMSTVLVAPSGLVQKAVGDVFLGHFAERFRVDPVRARRFLLTVAASLAVLSLVPGLIIGLWGAPAFALLYGAKWRLAGRLASLMVPVLMADLAIGPLGGALNVVNRPDAKLYFDAARLGGYAAAYLIATRATMPLDGMVTLFAQFSVVAYALYAAIIWFAIRHPRPVAQVTGDLQAISDSPLP